jgi:hypothetical protein
MRLEDLIFQSRCLELLRANVNFIDPVTHLCLGDLFQPLCRGHFLVLSVLEGLHVLSLHLQQRLVLVCLRHVDLNRIERGKEVSRE